MSDLGNDALPVRVEMWGDLQCLWCYIEFAVLRDAIAEIDSGELRFRTYSFRPDVTTRTPEDVPEAHVERQHSGMATLVADAGSDYNYANLRPTDSQKAHELVQFAGAYGKPGPMVDRLFRAHFADRLDIGDSECLADLAAECGLDRDEAITAPQ